jgi:cytochrome P450
MVAALNHERAAQVPKARTDIGSATWRERRERVASPREQAESRVKQQDVSVSGEANPAAFDFHGGSLDDIFSEYQRLLAQCPVGRSDRYGGFTFLTKLEDIFDAERHPEVFAVAPTMLLPAMGTDEPMIPIDIDPPALAGYRKVLLPLFTPRAIDKLTPGMRETARQLAQQVVDAGTIDASAHFARALPTIIFSRFCGFPEADWPRFDAWVDDIIYERTEDPARAFAAGEAVKKYFDDLLIARKHAEPADDLISVLLDATFDGRALSHEELISYCYTLFLAGLDTAVWAIRSAIWYLGRNLDAQRQLRREPGLIPAAAEEFLRTLSPVQAMARTCQRDTTVRGHDIKAGDRVVLVFGAGNRDPEAFEDPNTIRFDRETNRHLAFGGGVHRCLGSNLGRRELVVALEAFLAVVPEFTTPNSEESWHGVGPLTVTVVGGTRS